MTLPITWVGTPEFFTKNKAKFLLLRKHLYPIGNVVDKICFIFLSSESVS